MNFNHVPRNVLKHVFGGFFGYALGSISHIILMLFTKGITFSFDYSFYSQFAIGGIFGMVLGLLFPKVFFNIGRFVLDFFSGG